MDRYTILTLIGSALLSAFAFVAANNKTSYEHTNVEYITFEVGCVYTPSAKEPLDCSDSSKN